MLKKIVAATCLSFSLMMILPVAINTAEAKGIEIPKNTGLSDKTPAEVLDKVLNWLLMIFVIVATIAFVITGFQFIFSFGGASGTEAQAKMNLTYTIIAIFIVGGALIILNTIVGLLGGNSSKGGSGETNYGTEENPNYGSIDDNYNDYWNPTETKSTDWAKDARNLRNAEDAMTTRTKTKNDSEGNQQGRDLRDAEIRNKYLINGSEGLSNQDMPHDGL